MSLLARLSGHIPHDLVDLVVLQLVKDTIGSDQCVVEVVDPALLVCRFRFASDHASHPTKMGKLGLTVSESPTDGQSAREDTIRTNEGVLLFITVIFKRYSFLSNLLSCCGRHAIFHHGLGLVDVATSLHDSIELSFVRWLVIPRQHLHLRCCLHVHRGDRGGRLVCHSTYCTSRRVGGALCVHRKSSLAFNHGVRGVLAD